MAWQPFLLGLGLRSSRKRETNRANDDDGSRCLYRLSSIDWSDLSASQCCDLLAIHVFFFCVLGLIPWLFSSDRSCACDIAVQRHKSADSNDSIYHIWILRAPIWVRIDRASSYTQPRSKYACVVLTLTMRQGTHVSESFDALNFSFVSFPAFRSLLLLVCFARSLAYHSLLSAAPIQLALGECSEFTVFRTNMASQTEVFLKPSSKRNQMDPGKAWPTFKKMHATIDKI